ncbi:hypothetical protein [Runella sp.]|uniref:hypothetical protein n=1 Tax=Runella sp. TaxID=1960881 RepID=UPI003D104662
MKCLLENIKTALEILALVLGAFFFLWKLSTGWLIINLKLSIATTRKKKQEDSGLDYLGVEIVLEKGDIDTLYLNDISMKVVYDDKIIFLDFPELRKCKVITGIQKIDWNSDNLKEELITLSPNEKIQLGKFIEVPSNTPIFIEVAVLGYRRFWKNFHWKSSTISIGEGK